MALQLMSDKTGKASRRGPGLKLRTFAANEMVYSPERPVRERFCSAGSGIVLTKPSLSACKGNENRPSVNPAEQDVPNRRTGGIKCPSANEQERMPSLD
jgi:hypothetical protein